jgi:predicted ATPase/class 3 adenylate cyclase
MRKDLPGGTVTFLFTDIAGSTRLLDELGVDRYAEALADHRVALRAVFGGHGGVEVDTQGDAFFYVFASAPLAVQAAVDGQEVLAGGPIRVRMGLHTGTPRLAEEGYVGADVHRAARIAAVAHGEQVVLSSSTRALVDRPDLVDLGVHRLKDLSAPERICQVGVGTFPPLRSLYRTNLPIPATPFVSRARDTTSVLALISAGGRLITLTGPGGCGKTRLALQVAALASDDFPAGVFWVPLATITDPDLAPALTATAVGCADSLVDWIGDKRLLLILDNFEHLVDAASWLSDLLASTPQLQVLVTSREPLLVAAEQQYAVGTLNPAEGVELFNARAFAIDPDFRPDQAVTEICRRLDYLPLAIELAAARVKVLSPGQLLSRLDERLPLLTNGRRDAPARHRTLRATIDWSHDLLMPPEQVLFRRLAVFAGGCTLEAVEEVAGGDLGTLSSLVDKSLVQRTEDRYWMLETIREYAGERLLTDDDFADLRRRHCAYFAAIAHAAHLSVERCDEGQNYQLVIGEIANLREAIDAAEEAGDRELALSIAVALEQFWVVASPDEGRHRLTALLAGLPAGVPALLQARAIRALGGVTYIVGDFAAGMAHVRQALDIFRELGDDTAVGHLLVRMAIDAIRVNADDEAVRLLTEAETLPATRSDEAQRLSLRAEIAWREDRGAEALELLRRSAETAAAVGFVWWQSTALLTLAEYAFDLGQADLATDPMIELLELAGRIEDRMTLAYGLALAARHAAGSGDELAAGTWWAAVEADSRRAPIAQWDSDRAELAAAIVTSTETFANGELIGQAMTLTEAAHDAVQSMRSTAAKKTAP